MLHTATRILGLAALVTGPFALSAQAATVLTGGDGVIRNSLCVGFDCPNNPSFSDSTILMMENNTRIKFGDTNGGQSYLGFNDCGTASNGGGCATDLVFAIEAGARASALYVESDGDVGLGTSNPVTELHMVRGDTPTLRLEQNTSSGFGAQTWDIAGNETSFFIRDVSSGSTLPFRIRPGAPSQALVIDTDGDVGIVTLTSDAALHVVDGSNTNEDPGFKLSGTGTNFADVESTDGGATHLRLISTGANRRIVGKDTEADVPDGQLQFPQTGGAIIYGPANAVIATFDGTGLAVNGDITSTGTTVVPDYVFAEDYRLMPLSEVEAFIAVNRHLPRIPSAGEIAQRGLNMTEMQMALLEKVEELTLYTLEQERKIALLMRERTETRAD